ncbi:MAG: hypothetical protein WC437_05010 [Patescibacteria group bacterium]|jgi:hypothetical protein
MWFKIRSKNEKNWQATSFLLTLFPYLQIWENISPKAKSEVKNMTLEQIEQALSQENLSEEQLEALLSELKNYQ